MKDIPTFHFPEMNMIDFPHLLTLELDRLDRL